LGDDAVSAEPFIALAISNPINWRALIDAPIAPPMIPNKPNRRKITARNFENLESPRFSGMSELHDPAW
jgi:malate synthase